MRGRERWSADFDPTSNDEAGNVEKDVGVINGKKSIFVKQGRRERRGKTGGWERTVSPGEGSWGAR